MGEPVGAVAETTAGTLIAACRTGLRHVEAGDGPGQLVIPLPPGDADLRKNDGKADPAGRFVGGTMTLGDPRPGAGSLWSYSDGRAVELVGGVTISNGLAWSADGSTLFYIDTPTRQIDAFTYDVATGAVADRRTVVDIPAGAGDPDGMCIDAEGGLWVALWDGAAVHRYVERSPRRGRRASHPVRHVPDVRRGRARRARRHDGVGAVRRRRPGRRRRSVRGAGRSSGQAGAPRLARRAARAEKRRWVVRLSRGSARPRHRRRSCGSHRCAPGRGAGGRGHARGAGAGGRHSPQQRSGAGAHAGASGAPRAGLELVGDVRSARATAGGGRRRDPGQRATGGRLRVRAEARRRPHPRQGGRPRRGGRQRSVPRRRTPSPSPTAGSGAPTGSSSRSAGGHRSCRSRVPSSV